MNYLFIIGQVLLYTFILGLSLWGIKIAASLYIFSKKKEKINKLHARISILKLHLKAKIKRKCNKIETLLKKTEDAETLSLLRPKIKSIQDLTFTLTTDYQKLIEQLNAITQGITDHIKIKHRHIIKQQEAETPAAPVLSEFEVIQEKCKKLVKYDKAHMLIIVEIIQATDEIREEIEDYNILADYDKNQKKIKEIPDKIEIENYDIIAELVETSKTTAIDTTDFPILEKNLTDNAA